MPLRHLRIVGPRHPRHLLSGSRSFSGFGLIPAFQKSSIAERYGYSTKPYWKAFWGGIVSSVALVVVFYLVVIAAVFNSLNTASEQYYDSTDTFGGTNTYAPAPETNLLAENLAGKQTVHGAPSFGDL